MTSVRAGVDGFEPSCHGVKVRCVKPLRHTPGLPPNSVTSKEASCSVRLMHARLLVNKLHSAFYLDKRFISTVSR